MHFSLLSSVALACAFTATASPLNTRACTGPNVNSATVSLIKQFEGFVASPEPDPVGYPTVGYGHKCQNSGCSEVPYSFPLTESTATALLQSDLKVQYPSSTPFPSRIHTSTFSPSTPRFIFLRDRLMLTYPKVPPTNHNPKNNLQRRSQRKPIRCPRLLGLQRRRRRCRKLNTHQAPECRRDSQHCDLRGVAQVE